MQAAAVKGLRRRFFARFFAPPIILRAAIIINKNPADKKRQAVGRVRAIVAVPGFA